LVWKLRFIDEKSIESSMISFCKKFGYSDLLWIDTNLSKVQIYRLKFNIKVNKKSVFEKISTKAFETREIINIIKDQKVSAFMAESINMPVFKNAWANHIIKGNLRNR
jgi:hypothetical protein